HRRVRLDQPDHAGLRGGVVGLAAVAGDAGHRGDADDPATGGEEIGQGGVDPVLAGQVDVQHAVPAVFGHPPERLVAGDAGVVHDDVDPAVPFLYICGEFRGCVGSGEVELERAAVYVVRDRGQRVPGGGHVEADDVGAVPGQEAGDGRPDAPRGAGDQ